MLSTHRVYTSIVHAVHCIPLGPSGPPRQVEINIASPSSVSVSWLPPHGGAERYIIADRDGCVKEETVEEEQMLVVDGLSQGKTYNIILYAYKDLPSVASEPVSIQLDSML